jgi:uroporphyrinogen III methyltransferase/synthase
MPEVGVVPFEGHAPIEASLARLQEFNGIVFGCAAGVDAVVSHALTFNVPVIAVGMAAAQALSRHGIPVTFAVRGACQEALVEHGIFFQKGQFLLVTAEGGRPNLQHELMKIGAEVETIAVYRYVHQMPTVSMPPIDLVVLPSSSAARTVLSGDFGQALLGVPMVAIGPQTEAAARQYGAQSVVRAKEDSVASLVSLVVSMVRSL